MICRGKNILYARTFLRYQKASVRLFDAETRSLKPTNRLVLFTIELVLQILLLSTPHGKEKEASGYLVSTYASTAFQIR